MEPLRADVKKAILDANPQADPADIEEYERLLSERFARDPEVPVAQPELSASLTRQDRLAELHRKLFPGFYSRRQQ